MLGFEQHASSITLKVFIREVQRYKGQHPKVNFKYIYKQTSSFINIDCVNIVLISCILKLTLSIYMKWLNANKILLILLFLFILVEKELKNI